LIHATKPQKEKFIVAIAEVTTLNDDETTTHFG
jgi:hypothetical protein